MNLSEITEQRLNEARTQRSQIIAILHQATDATQRSPSTFQLNSVARKGVAAANEQQHNITHNHLEAPTVFEGDDRSLMNVYRTSMLRTPPPLCDVAALRVDDLITAFLRFRRSLHHLCYQAGMNAAHQKSEVGILEQRIEKTRNECFEMLEQLRQGIVECPVETTRPIEIIEAPQVANLRSAITSEKEKLKLALQRLEQSNYAPK